MKKILILGKNSYVGEKLYCYLNNKKCEYLVDSISLRNVDIQKLDLSSYDTVIYLVGIAHKKETKQNKALYYDINYKLTCDFAEECKKQHVEHFLFISSMSVFGSDEGMIDQFTIPKPKTHYGKSKLLAENYLVQNLRDNKFNVTIVRPPMIYGFKSIGNYSKLSSLSKKTPLFLNVKNKRSMIYIENLLFYIEEILKLENPKTYYHPQNSYYMNTSLMVKEIAGIHQKKVKFININKFALSFLLKIKILNKIFGDLYYSHNFSKDNNINFIEKDFLTSIHRSEQKY